MAVMIKAAVIAVICAAAALITKSYIPEFTPFIQIAAVLAVVLSVSQTVSLLTEYISGFITAGSVDSAYVLILFKVLSVAVMGRLGSDLCRDCGNSALAFALETVSKIVIISMCLPMLRNLTEITAGLLKG